ncbi:regulator, partial [Marivirga lumbricoides]
MTKIYYLLICLLPIQLFCQTPCENGSVNGYPCNQVDLYARLSNTELSGDANIESADIWGWTDPDTGKEYALVGMTNGIVFVDISSPATPVIIGRLPSHTGKSSLWRDLNVFNN